MEHASTLLLTRGLTIHSQSQSNQTTRTQPQAAQTLDSLTSQLNARTTSITTLIQIDVYNVRKMQQETHLARHVYATKASHYKASNACQTRTNLTIWASKSLFQY